MPIPLEYMDLTEKMVYWAVVAHDREGFPLLSSPVELSVRWEEFQREMLSPTGERMSVDVTIATTQNLVMNSLVWEGSLEDLADIVGTSYIPESGIYEVVNKARAKSLQGEVTRYEFGISRYKDTLPRVIS